MPRPRPRPAAEPRPLPHPRSRGRRGQTGGRAVFRLLFCPSCILACQGHTRGSAARGPPCCPPHTPARQGGQEESPPIHKPHIHTSPLLSFWTARRWHHPTKQRSTRAVCHGGEDSEDISYRNRYSQPPKPLHSCPQGLQPPAD